MSNKPTLTLADFKLLKNSEEPKNKVLYGNLYDVLSSLELKSAATENDLQRLNEFGKNALTHNKKLLLENAKKEWKVMEITEEDNSKKVHCGLCNRVNKYIFFIQNQINGSILNIGSECVKNYEGITGYQEHQEKFKQIKKNHEIAERRNKFHQKFPLVEEEILNATTYFNTLPILLPYDLYTKLSEKVKYLEQIYNLYVKEDKKPYNSTNNSFELYELTLNAFEKIKIEADSFVERNLSNPLICKRPEINWLIGNKRNILLQKIAQNNGTYTKSTIQQMTSPNFLLSNQSLFFGKNKSMYFTPVKIDVDKKLILFETSLNAGYTPSIKFIISFNDFMNYMGANCIINDDYTYCEQEIIEFFKIETSFDNIAALIVSTADLMLRTGHAFLLDTDTHKVYLYRRANKSTLQIDYGNFAEEFKKYLLSNDSDIEKYFRRFIKKHQDSFLSVEKQERIGIRKKIAWLYKSQYKEE